MTEAAGRVRPLLRTRQVREFTAEPVSAEALDALADVARWTGSSSNEQPWRFILISGTAVLREIATIGTPQTRPFLSATAAIATVLPADPAREIHDAYDDGRVAERLLVAAGLLGLGGAITWVRANVRAPIGELLGLPPDWFVRSMVAFGHPTAAALRPKSPTGTARRPRAEMVFAERWPG